MKKAVCALLAALMLLVLNAACAQDAQAVRTPVFSTMAEALASADDAFSGWYDRDYVAVIRLGDRYLRVVAAVDGDVLEKYDAIEASIDYDDFGDYQRAEDEMEALGLSLEVAYTEDITGAILPQKELDALAGKTVDDLETEGFRICSHGYNGVTGEVVFELEKGMFRYAFVMNEPAETYLDLYESEDFGGLTVRSARFEEWGSGVLDLRLRADGTQAPAESGEASEGPDLVDLLIGLLTGGADESGE